MKGKYKISHYFFHYYKYIKIDIFIDRLSSSIVKVLISKCITDNSAFCLFGLASKFQVI